MKVGILTWHNVLNHGAVLQAYASSSIIRNMGHTPLILEHNYETEDEAFLKKRLRQLKKITISKLLWKYKVTRFLNEKNRRFKVFVSKYLNIGPMVYDVKDLGALYIGSDMVFDVVEGYNPYFYGVGVESPYKFSYAASFGYTTKEILSKHRSFATIAEGLRSLDAIGYRDKNTKNLVSFCGINENCFECIDPALAYGFKEEFNTWDEGKWSKRKYILVYAYDTTMNEPEVIKEVKEYAKNHNLEIISCGYYHNWCDESIQADPKEFIEMIKYASIVLTDTFHGTIFGLLAHRRVVVKIRANGFKLSYLLTSSNMEDSVWSEKNTFEGVLEKELDYDCFDKWLNKKQIESIDFIQSQLNKASEKGVK